MKKKILILLIVAFLLSLNTVSADFYVEDVSIGYSFDADYNDAYSGWNFTAVGDTHLASGILGNASFFDSTGDYLRVNDTDYFNGRETFSVSLWFKMDNAGTTEYVFWSGTTSPNFWIGKQTNNYLKAYARTSVTGHCSSITSKLISTDTWYHVFVTFDGSYLTTWVNGDLVGNTTCSGVINTYSGADFGVSNTNDWTYYSYDGAIDELYIFDDIGTETEATQLYGSGSPDYLSNRPDPTAVSSISPDPAYTDSVLQFSCDNNNGAGNVSYNWEYWKNGVSVNSSDNIWAESAVTDGLISDVGDWSVPEYWYMDGVLNIIIGENDGVFNTYTWNTDWDLNDTLKNGLPDVGYRSAPEVFNMSGSWKLITGNDTAYRGFDWNGSIWTENTTLVAGLPSGGSVWDLFTIGIVEWEDGNWIAMTSEIDGTFQGFYWNGTGWTENSTLLNGLVADVGTYGHPELFIVDGTRYFLGGEQDTSGLLNPYSWNGTSWVSDDTMVKGLTSTMIKQSAPATVHVDGNLNYMITGSSAGLFNGFNIYNSNPIYDASSSVNFFNVSSTFDKHDVFVLQCSVIFNDGANESAAVNDTITVSNYVSDSGESSISNVSGLLTGSGKFADNDSDGLVYDYEWFVDGSSESIGSKGGSDWYVSNLGFSHINNFGFDDTYTHPEIFSIDNSYYMIIGGDTDIYGYSYNGTSWVSNSSIIAGISISHTRIQPNIFYIDNQLKSWFCTDGAFYAYDWNGTSWVSNTSIYTGISYSYSTVTTMNMSDDIVTVVGLSNGFTDFYTWNGSQWIDATSTYDVGVTNDVGNTASPELVTIDDEYYLFIGESSAALNTFKWNGSQWNADSSIDDDLTIGTFFNAGGYTMNGIDYISYGLANGTLYNYVRGFSENTSQDISTLDLSTVNASVGVDVIFSIRAFDGDDYTDWVNSSAFTIPNFVPDTPIVVISPSNPFIDDTLLGNCTGSDDNYNDRLDYYYRWYKNDVLNSSGSLLNLSQDNYNIANMSLLTYNDNWTFSCLTSDGTDNSSWVNSSSVTIDYVRPAILVLNPVNNSANSSRNVNYSASIDTKGLSINMTFLNSSNGTLQSFTGISNSTQYSYSKSEEWNTNYFWYINLSHDYGSELFSLNFSTSSQPLPSNYRVSEINGSSIEIVWDNNSDIEWTSYTLYRSGVVDVTGITTDYSKVVTGLAENSDYVLVWQVGDDAPSESDYFNFSLRTAGWMPSLENWSYKRLVTINSSSFGDDVDGGAVNISLDNDNFKICTAYCSYPGWEVWASGFSHLNWTTGDDLRVADYYETEVLGYNITFIDVGGDGGVTTQTIPNATGFDGTWDNYSLCHDGDWNTRCIPNTYAVDYFNYTIPSGALTSSVFRAYYGTYYWDGSIPSDCFGGSDLRFRIRANYSTPVVDLYCQNDSDDSWVYMDDNGNVSSYNYESMITWYYAGQLDFTVVPKHFNDSGQDNVLGVDGDYDTTFWLYYGNGDASNNESEDLVYSSLVDATYTVGSETEFSESAPIISGINDSINRTATGTTINWSLDKLSNSTVIYATNEWFLGSVNSTSDNSTLTPSIVLSGLSPDTVYYYRLSSSGLTSGLTSTSDGSFTLGTPPSTPGGFFLNYTEDRTTQVATVCFYLSDLDGASSVDASIQYWNEDSETFNETTNDSLSGVGGVCKNISVDFGKTYNYRLKMVGDTTGYSAEYTNEFMSIQEFFAGSYVEDDMDYRSRQYCPGGVGTLPCYEQKGYREGSMQEEDWIWIETNITGFGALSVEWYNGSDWDSYSMTLDDDGFYYKKLDGLGSDYQTFYIKNSTSTILNWTKPDLNHSNTGNRTETSKFVSFGAVKESIDYQILYLEYDNYVGTSYDHCIASGGNLFDCMSVSTYGYDYLSSSLVGYDYDRGRLFRGGVTNGGPVDTGKLVSSPSTREINDLIVHDWGSMPQSGRMCFAFSVYYWDLDKLPSDNITSFYYRYWTQDQWWSTYYGYTQDRRFDYTCIRYYNDSSEDWGGFGSSNCLSGTLLESEVEVQHEDNDTFGTAYDQTLVSGFKDGFVVDTRNDRIYDIVPYFDAQWTNQMINKYQQAYIIYNLPSNATLVGLDSDSDGLNDFEELYTYYTNPKVADTDNDGYDDGFEVNYTGDANVYVDIPAPFLDIVISDDNFTASESSNISCFVYHPVFDFNFSIFNSSSDLIYSTNVSNSTYVFNGSVSLLGNYSVSCYGENVLGVNATYNDTFVVEGVGYVAPSMNVSISGLYDSDDLLGRVVISGNNSANVTFNYTWYRDGVAFLNGSTGSVVSPGGFYTVSTIYGYETDVSERYIFEVVVSDDYTVGNVTNSSFVIVQYDLLGESGVGSGGGFVGDVPVIVNLSGGVLVIDDYGKSRCDLVFVPDALVIDGEREVGFTVENREVGGVSLSFTPVFSDGFGALSVVGDVVVGGGDVNSFILRVSPLFKDGYSGAGYLNVSSLVCDTVLVPVSISVVEDDVVVADYFVVVRDFAGKNLFGVVPVWLGYLVVAFLFGWLVFGSLRRRDFGDWFVQLLVVLVVPAVIILFLRMVLG